MIGDTEMVFIGRVPFLNGVAGRVPIRHSGSARTPWLQCSEPRPRISRLLSTSARPLQRQRFEMSERPSPIRGFLARRFVQSLVQHAREELPTLISLLMLTVGLWAFAELADEVLEQETPGCTTGRSVNTAC